VQPDRWAARRFFSRLSTNIQQHRQVEGVVWGCSVSIMPHHLPSHASMINCEEEGGGVMPSHRQCVCQGRWNAGSPSVHRMAHCL
jgi:hypothetical protein